MANTPFPKNTKPLDSRGNWTLPLLNWFNGLGSGAIGTPTFTVEIPVGAVDGVNNIYIISQPPLDLAAVMVFKNGQKLARNIGYQIAAMTITIQPGYTLQSGDSIEVGYQF